MFPLSGPDALLYGNGSRDAVDSRAAISSRPWAASRPRAPAGRGARSRW